MRLASSVRLGVACVATVAIAACSTKEAAGPIEPTGAFGRVRLVNLITDSTRGRVNSSLEGLVFTVNLTNGLVAPANLPAPATGARYAAVYTGSRTFVLKRTADTTVTVATIPFTVADGQDQTVYVLGGAGGSAITNVAITDTNPAAASTETRLRIVNMSPASGAVDVFVTAVGADLATATARATSLASDGASAYFSVAPGAYQIRTAPAGTASADRAASVTLNVATTTFAGGTGRTIVIADAPAGGAPIRGLIVADR